MANFYKSMWTYPWDLQDEGITPVLDRLHQHGINGVNVTSIYHSGMFFLPHNPNRKLYFPQPGALYFEPDQNWYGKKKIQPPISPLASRQFWYDLREETLKRNMKLSSWTLALHNSQIGFAYPETNVVNPFGDYIPTALCPSSEAVREFLCALIEDMVMNYEFDSILVESLEYMPFRHGYHHEVIGVPLTPTVEFLMTLSFSESMMAKAKNEGIEIEAVRRFVQEQCQRQFSAPYEEKIHFSWEQLHQAVDGEFYRYLQLRQQLLTSMIAEISAIVKKKPTTKLAAVDFGPLYPMGPDGTSWENGVNLNDWSLFIDELHPTFYFADSGQLHQKIAEYFNVISTLQQKPQIIPAIRAILPQAGNEEQLRQQIALLRPQSDGFTFYNYGFMPYTTLDWLEKSL